MKFRTSTIAPRIPDFVRAAFLAAVVTSAIGCVHAEPPEPAKAEVLAGAIPQPTSRNAEGVFGGKRVPYKVALETTTIQAGVPGKGADIVSFSYVADDATAQRPVLFVFNGGPITASLWLHIGAVGPYRVSLLDDLSAPTSEAILVPNSYSPLDVADIVFFDPATTGYSRVKDGVDPSIYYSVKGDGEECADFIEAWLRNHGRTGSPVFILGESYGTIRAAEVAGQLAERGADHAASGVFLMGQAVNIIEYAQRDENIISFVVSLPTLAATAWELGKVDTEGRTFDAFMADAKTFGETEYLTALFQGANVDPEIRVDVAQKLEKFTGIPAEYYVEHNLRISKEKFRVELLKDENLILGRSDARYTGQVAPGADPSGVLQSIYETAFGDYVRKTFGFEVDEAYILSASTGGWTYGAPSPFDAFAFGKRMDPAFEANPDFRLLIGNGYQDTMTTVGAAEYAVTQSNWPQDRVRTAFYKGGHMAYSVEASAKAFGDDIRSWITGWQDTGSGK